jgi:AcrR family transcriptional regulator
MAEAASKPDEGGMSRVAQKRQTRQRIEDAALNLMASGCGFSGLSLRQVTKEAGLTPAAYYRHFADLDTLGLALVMRGGETLRRLLRQVRQDDIPPERMLRASVRIFLRHVQNHRMVFAFLATERHGASSVIRQAILDQETRFVDEMSQDMTALGSFPHLSEPTLKRLCRLVVTTMFNAAADATNPSLQQPGSDEVLADEWLGQLRLVLIGARHWRETRRTLRRNNQ